MRENQEASGKNNWEKKIKNKERQEEFKWKRNRKTRKEKIEEIFIRYHRIDCRAKK